MADSHLVAACVTLHAGGPLDHYGWHWPHGRRASILGAEVRRVMNCYFCTEADAPQPAVGICTDCGRAVCERHGTVETVSVSIRTGNMFEQRQAEARRLHCEDCRALVAAR